MTTPSEKECVANTEGKATTRLRTVYRSYLLHSFGIKSRTRCLAMQSATSFSLTEIVYANPHASWEKNPAEAGQKAVPYDLSERYSPTREETTA